MSNRAIIIAPAVIAGCVSIFSIMSAPARAEPATEPAAENAAADECLSAPKPSTPAGAHWYYRIEKGTKRKCWYLSDAGGKLKSTATVEESAAPENKPMRKSVANARAELRAGSPDEDSSLAETTWPPLTSSADAALQPNNLKQDNQSAAIQPAPEPATRQGSNITSRWPEPVSIASAENQTNANAPVAVTPAPAQPGPALTPDRLAAAAAPAVTTPAAPTPAATPVVTTQPAAETADNDSFSIRILLAVLVCALALAAIVGPMLFKYIRPRRREEQRTQRRPIWDMNLSDDIVRQDNPRMPSPARYADALPEPRILDEATDEIEELLARASRRSAA